MAVIGWQPEMLAAVKLALWDGMYDDALRHFVKEEHPEVSRVTSETLKEPVSLVGA